MWSLNGEFGGLERGEFVNWHGVVASHSLVWMMRISIPFSLCIVLFVLMILFPYEFSFAYLLA
jgi:hypothetical protein